ncbi:MFS transporter [Ureibacillus sp. MALMAid1270]|uniref:MFS transporter n=1 Tax=Ureibacillus sp. MALMAid1270 TaxID=3411629 RepID=UPI003BA48C85
MEDVTAVITTPESQKVHHLEGESPSFGMIFNDKRILKITLNLTIVNFFFGGFNVYIVKIAADIGSPVMLGLLNSTLAIGTLVGATIFSQKILKNLILGSKLVLCSCLFGVMLVFTSFFASSVWVIFPLTIGAVFLGVTQILTHPIVQTIVPEEKLGRVFSAQYTISVGIMPLGSLIFGKVAEIMSSEIFFILIGIVYILIGISYWLQKEIAHFSLTSESNGLSN